MTPDRWREVERLYQEALERTPEERSAFLHDACQGDEALCVEVESLLGYEPGARDFIEVPPSVTGGGPVGEVIRSLRDSYAPGRFAGRVFGVYELKAPIGAGGMGEIYRAVDTRLERTVAIKILSEQTAGDSALRERFKREAKLVSSLNHPHICALYDVGTQDGVDYLVMEYLEGETLEKLLRRGPLPLPQALEYLIQIVDALDKVHRRGIVHRDLKPDNVMITRSGVKLLDFGVAARLVLRSGAQTAPLTASADPPLTAAGMVIGTVPYMAPEQLQGLPPDARTDLFALGAMAYEMITGQRAFQAKTQAELISAILRDDPPSIDRLVPDVPNPMARTIERCLAKDPEDRWQSAGDLLFQLRSSTTAPAGLRLPSWSPARGSRWLERAVWAAALAILAVLAWTRPDKVEDRSAARAVPVRFSLSPAAGVFLSGMDVPLALSPDGKRLAYVGMSSRRVQQIWLRSLDSEEHRALPGTEGASTPFWSPDSQWLGFFAEGALKKVRISSGLTQVVASHAATFGGATWSRDDVILFPAVRGGLTRVSARGGPVSRVAIDDSVQFSPHFLDDGQHFIYAASAAGALRVGSLRSEPPRTLMNFPVRISTLGYAQGHVFYVQDSTLFARPFDEKRLAFSAGPIRIVEGIPVTTPARAPYSVSASGVLAYWPYTLGTPAVFRWFDRSGRSSPPLGPPAQYRGFALASDGRRLVFSRISGNGADLWLRNVDGNGEVQLTFEGAAVTPQWSPDGNRIAYSGYGQGPPPKLYVRNAAGTAAASLVASTQLANFASGWSADGRSILSVRTTDPASRHDLWVQSLEQGRSERLALNTPSNESQGKISPDGRWIAYTTDHSGKDEVWVASFPEGDRRRQVSNAGGRFPQWGAGSSEIVYVSEDKKLMAARIRGAGDRVEAGLPEQLFGVANLIDVETFLWPTAYPYVSTADGQRFLVAVSEPDPDAPPIQVIVNWPRLLDR